MDGAQVALRVAAAAHRFVHLGGVAMRFDVGGIALERAQETAQRVLMLLLSSIEQAELHVHLGAGGGDHGGAEQMTQCAAQVTLALQQRSEAHMRLVVAGLAAEQLAVNSERAERVLIGDSARLFETFAHSRRSETFLDFAGLIAALEIEEELTGLGFDEHGAVAHDDAPLVVDQFERSDTAVGSDEIAHPIEASLDRLDMLA